MFAPKKINRRLLRIGSQRLHALFTELRLIASQQAFAGQFECLAYLLEDARAALIDLGFDLPLRERSRCGISKDAILREVRGSCELLAIASHHRHDRKVHLRAFTACAAAIQNILASNNIAALIGRRDDAARSGSIGNDAEGLMQALIEIDESCEGRPTTIPVDELGIRHAYVLRALENFHRLDQPEIEILARAMRSEPVPHGAN